MPSFKRTGDTYPTILNDTGLNLTEAGKISLCQYPDDALKAAIAEIKHSPHKEDPYQTMHIICMSWCKQNKIWKDTDWVDAQFQEHGWDYLAAPIDYNQPYLTKQQHKQQQPKRIKDGHIRTLEPEEIEPLKKKYRESVQSVAAGQETYDNEPNSRNKAWLQSYINFRNEIKELLLYNGIEYEFEPFSREESTAQAIENLLINRASSGSHFIVQMIGEELVYNVEREILKRAEKYDSTRMEQIHPLLR